MVFARVGWGNTHVRAIKGQISSVPDSKRPDSKIARSCFKQGYVNFLNFTSKFLTCISDLWVVRDYCQTFSVTLSESCNQYSSSTNVYQQRTKTWSYLGPCDAVLPELNVNHRKRSCSKKMFLANNEE